MTRSRRFGLTAALLASALTLTGCSTGGDAPAQSDSPETAGPTTIRVAAVTSPMTDVVEAAASAADDSIDIELVEVGDYVTVNRLLADGDVEANFAQHVPFMEGFNEGNDADLTALHTIYNFTIAFYSKSYDSIDDLPQGALIALPNDASNLGRALKLLDAEGLIALDPGVDPYAATVDDIAENPREFEFLEVEINQLNSAYEEADLVFQWPSHISALGLNPQDDGLITELDDRFALVLAVRGEDADSAVSAALIEAFTSDAVREVIESNATIEVAF